MISARILLPRILLPLSLVVITAGLPACSSHKGPPPPTFSPNGEPLVPPQWPRDCEEALGQWFDRLDSRHAGTLTFPQLLADAEIQYRKMDLRHDGKITAEELSKYRLSLMGGHYLSVSTPGQRNFVAGREPDEDDPEASDLDRAFGDPGRHRKDDRPVDAFAALVTDQPDPVMSADSDLDGSVTPEEFRALVAQNFADFDKEHTGVITKSEVEGSCSKNR
jgi:Ca2+-binding EF-hand superfamily protein